MPGFQLTPKEALALAAFLETQKEIAGQWPELPASLEAEADMNPRPVSRQEFERELAGGLLCLTCHTMGGRGGKLGVELTEIGHRLRHDWVKRYLAAPAMYGVPATTMPAQFYQVSADGKRFEAIRTNVMETIATLTDYLYSLSAVRRAAQEEKWREATAAFARSATSRAMAVACPTSNSQ
jgi:hypothetical protein